MNCLDFSPSVALVVIECESKMVVVVVVVLIIVFMLIWSAVNEVSA